MKVCLIASVCLLIPAVACGGDLRIIAPSFGLGFAKLEHLDSGEFLEIGEPIKRQEAQLFEYSVTNLPDGRYRVSYVNGGNPLGFVETFMETHVVVSNEETKTVFLHDTASGQVRDLPDEIKAFLAEHPKSYLELTYTFGESDHEFTQVRLNAWAIWYLRNDCDYTIRVWNHSYDELELPKKRSVIFEREFRASAADKAAEAIDSTVEQPRISERDAGEKRD